MAVRIRLRRIGKKKQPQYRLIVADSAAPRDGRFIESIGRYNPRIDPPLISVDEERALAWLKQGAQPSDTAKSMLVKTGIWEKFSGEPAPTPTAAPVAEAVAEAPSEPTATSDEEPAGEKPADPPSDPAEGEGADAPEAIPG